MLFPTISFVLFFLLVSVLWPLLPDSRQARSGFLAVANALFYAAASVPLLAYLTGWSICLWWAGRKGSFARLTVGVGVLQLAFWKTFELLPKSQLPEPFAHWVVPLGVSFFTFQGLTYLFARQQKQLLQPWSLLDVLGFVSFFPTVLSGPILRATDWERQIASDPRKNQTPATFSRAMGWLCLGLFYKLVLSTLLGESVDAAWSEPSEQNPVSLWLSVYGYSFQLYTDFCGYSYLAAAVALLLGFEVPRNFDRPYLSQSVQEFWRRWHMTLSHWLRDYLYIAALKGNAKGKRWQVVNVVVTFLVCGAWHGLALHYLVWGVWQALGVAYSTVAKLWLSPTSKPVSTAGRILRWFLAFHFIAFGWVWFRAPDFTTALEFFKALVAPGGTWQAEHGMTLLVIVGAALAHLGEHRLADAGNVLTRYVSRTWAQLVFWAVVLMTILAASPAGLPPFIYFKY